VFKIVEYGYIFISHLKFFMKSYLQKYIVILINARCYASMAYAMMWSLSVCPSVMFMNSVKTNNISSNFFLPSGSQTIRVFLYQTAWQHYDGNPVKGASNARWVGINCDS